MKLYAATNKEWERGAWPKILVGERSEGRAKYRLYIDDPIWRFGKIELEELREIPFGPGILALEGYLRLKKDGWPDRRYRRSKEIMDRYDLWDNAASCKK